MQKYGINICYQNLFPYFRVKMISQLLFALLFAAALWLIVKRIKTIQATINLGRPLKIEPSAKRWKQMALIALGQGKMFKKPVPALLHLIVYLGFIIVNIELAEILWDGFFGAHRIARSWLGNGFYAFVVNFCEFSAVAVALACTLFLVRRNILRIERFRSHDLKKKPFLDGNIILFFEIALMVIFLVMNAADSLLSENQELSRGYFFSSAMQPMLCGFSRSSLLAIERGAWWLHILGILGFALYVTYSKHLHIVLAFPNTYFANTERGNLSPMPTVTNEVKSMFGLPSETTEAPPRFGAKDVTDLAWTHLLAAYSCTECGRCSAQCPATATGKKLSPRRIMMATRDRLEDIAASSVDNGKTLLHDFISKEELNACTTCHACAEACPVLINPMDIILEMRRFVAMEEAASPQAWNMMFQNIETNFAPWKFPAADRFKLD
ncbi:MAG: Fe-S oxidoreductase [Candidatus Nephrothrix sp. EaCA]|nr:MAG: Fe-S oxidoreductase [Candidatus Nephrothrix sp. EaCA]